MTQQGQGQVVRPAFQAQGTAPGDAIMPVQESATEVLAAQAREIVRARYLIAMQRPRDMDAVRQKLTADCGRFSFADPALYKRPIGGEKKTGLSIRFVEAALRYMGNVDVSPSVIYDNEAKRIVRVTVTDLETNAVHSKDLMIEKTVERKKVKDSQPVRGSRINSYGEKVYLVDATEDELSIKVDALSSKAIRQLGCRIIPGDLQDECLTLIRETIAKKIEADPDAEQKKIIDAFFDQGILVEHLKKYLGVDDLGVVRDAKSLMDLRAVYQALKSGEATWRQIMEAKDADREDPAQPAAPDAKSTRTQEVLNKIKPAQPAPVKPCEFCGMDPRTLKPGVACCLRGAVAGQSPRPVDTPAPEQSPANFDPKTIAGVSTGAQTFNRKPKPNQGE